ncbi:putative phospholipase D/nuclease [Acanthamoeba polyphaga mimivirus]|uniref:Phospholipase D/nuclease n=1 Tax=Acanthamoeba polyphaga mimivirus Kroon TaxID=3069720 RepID=A0A0G2Y2X9_9VIRU|nr:putative phospholipase D/nuclease [Acanthamoeba polyphaga mimivirus]AKI80115.1 putative phospholipase D/nuclease [Acanthamoeba polyphaga mimivirus Kroon]
MSSSIKKKLKKDTKDTDKTPSKKLYQETHTSEDSENSEDSDNENNTITMFNSTQNFYKYINLNKIKSSNYHSEISDNSIRPYFENLEQHLVEYINKATYVIGCIAWLTNDNIISSLQQKKGIKIIVNKEEFLNPNMEIAKKNYYCTLRSKYQSLPNMFTSKCYCCNDSITNCKKFNKIFGSISMSENNNSAVLTCGIVNSLPKMHHKFLIFFDENLDPVGVWTGSYNLSKTSNFSLENALYITSQIVIAEYIKEFLAVYKHSENFNWKSGTLYGKLKNTVY